jgi:hypothetical protein
MGKFVDLTGQRFGRLVVIEKAERTKNVKNTAQYWFCRCDCGKEKIICGTNLRNESIKSCGCLQEEMRRITNRSKDITNQRYGRLVAIKKAYVNNARLSMWLCKCDCGEEVIIDISSLRRGNTQSCGCYGKEQRSKANTKQIGEAAFNKLLYNYKKNAKARNIPFELTREEFNRLTRENCFYCDSLPAQIVAEPGMNGGYLYNGIDRINSSLGYTIENCVPCCGRCNEAKMDVPQRDFLSWIDRVHAHIHRNDPIDVTAEMAQINHSEIRALEE